MVSEKSITCTACGQTKALASFRVWIDREQALREGYTGERRVLVERSRCSDCRPRAKAPSEMSNKQLKRKAAAGVIPEITVRNMLKKREGAARAKMSAAAGARWEKILRGPWLPVLKELSAEVKRAQDQIRHAKKRTPATPELVSFLTLYKDVLIVKKAEATLASRKADKLNRAPSSWHELFDSMERGKVWTAWDGVPIEQRVNGRIPALLADAR